jgi:hypothetical protein
MGEFTSNAKPFYANHDEKNYKTTTRKGNAK